jgi:hypothetical protein
VRAAQAKGIKPLVGVDALLQSTLGSRGLNLFSVIACGDQVRAKKPAPDIYRLALHHLGVAPERAAGELAKRSLRAKVLPVSAAFHSAMVADAREPFAAALADVQFSQGSIPVYANSTAKAYPSGAQQARELLASQIVQPVNFISRPIIRFKPSVVPIKVSVSRRAVPFFD